MLFAIQIQLVLLLVNLSMSILGEHVPLTFFLRIAESVNQLHFIACIEATSLVRLPSSRAAVHWALWRPLKLKDLDVDATFAHSASDNFDRQI